MRWWWWWGWGRVVRGDWELYGAQSRKMGRENRSQRQRILSIFFCAFFSLKLFFFQPVCSSSSSLLLLLSFSLHFFFLFKLQCPYSKSRALQSVLQYICVTIDASGQYENTQVRMSTRTCGTMEAPHPSNYRDLLQGCIQTV